jgi:hypothetical protein
MAGEYNQLALDAHFKQINDRLRKIEEQLKALSTSTGVPYEDPRAEVSEDVIALAEAGDTMEAAKRYRKETGAGMERALEVVSGI